MKIEILGTGCKKCQSLTDNVTAAVAEAGSGHTITKVEDIPSIMAYGMISTPALVVDGEVRVAGRVASVEEIKALLR